MSVVESAVCVAQGQNERIPSKEGLEDPRSEAGPRKGKDGATMEEVSSVGGFSVILRTRTVCER